MLDESEAKREIGSCDRSNEVLSDLVAGRMRRREVRRQELIMKRRNGVSDKEKADGFIKGKNNDWVMSVFTHVQVDDERD